MAIITIEVKNWAKFNPRSDRANYSWFRLDNNFFHDQSVFGLSSQDKLSYIFVLCELSKKNKESVGVDVEYAAAMLRLHEDEFMQSVIRLEESGLIKTSLTLKKPSSRRRKAVIAPSLLPATRRDETDVTNETDETYTSPTPVGPSLPQLALIWNEGCGTLPKVRDAHPTSMRRKHAELRWREQPDAAYWRDVVKRVTESDFLMGRAKTDRPWRASFDWLIKPDTSTKILEGKYANQTSQYSGSVDPNERQILQEIFERAHGA